MSIHEEIFLAIDTANSCGVIAAFDASQIYAEELLSEKMMHARLIGDAIVKVEAQLGAQHKKLSGILVGRGPGSFVGIRIAMATALGFSFGRGLPLVGFCSHRALASAGPMGPIAVVMKASGDWCYMTQYLRSDEALIEIKAPREILKDQVLKSLKAGTCLISDVAFEQEALSRASISLVFSQGPSSLGLHQALKPFFAGAQILDESDFIKPNYVRAPSVTMPKAKLSELSSPIVL